MKAHRGGDAKLHSFSTLVLGGDEMVNFTLRLIYAREGTPADMEQEAAGIRTPDSPARSLVTF